MNNGPTMNNEPTMNDGPALNDGPTMVTPLTGMEVGHSSRIELSMTALRHNLNFLRSKLSEETILSSVVKANAYGHGIEEFVPMAEACGVNHFSVASSQEASRVLEVCSPGSTIMIMGILYSEDLPWVIAHGIEFFVFDLDRLREAARVAEQQNRPALVHLEVEIGTYRTGLALDQIPEALAILKENKKQLRFRGLCSHLAGIETLASQFRIKKQLERFESALRMTRSARCKPQLRHVSCSAAVLAFPELSYDLVRVGTAQYGMWPSPDIQNLHLIQNPPQKLPELKRVLTWKTNIMQLKEVPRDAFIGYGTAFQAPNDMRIAVLPVGYANGFSRDFSNRGQVLIRGRRCPVVGLVNMNVCTVDVSQVADIEIGDEVVLVGKQKKNVLAVGSFSEFSNLLNNEFIARLPSDIPRTAVR
jgi:alanine racemase